MFRNFSPGGRRLPITGTLIMLLIMGFLVISMGFLAQERRATEGQLALARATKTVQAASAETTGAGKKAADSGRPPSAKAPPPVKLPDLKMKPAKSGTTQDSEAPLDLPKGTLRDEPGPGWVPPGEERRESTFMSQLATTLVGLGAVCLLAFLVLRFVGARILGKSALTPFGGGRSTKLINILERQLIAPQKMLLLVDVAGKYMLIGMSENSLYTLGEVDGDLVEDRIKEAQESASQPLQGNPLKTVVSHYFPFLQQVKAAEKNAPAKKEEVNC
jgi:flagellar biogenesis protein FliO